jgi:hypothetical protein
MLTAPLFVFSLSLHVAVRTPHHADGSAPLRVQVVAAARAALGPAHALSRRMEALLLSDGDGDGDGDDGGGGTWAAVECYYRPHVAQQQVRTTRAPARRKRCESKR